MLRRMSVHVVPCLSRSLFYLLVVFTARISCNGVRENEATLGIIKPDGVLGNYTDSIKEAIVEAGFRISKEKSVILDEKSAAQFYSEHAAKAFFRNLVKYMTSGPVLVMLLEKENAVPDWRTLIGPTDGSKAKITHPRSIRAMCGTDIERNCVHGSDSPASASREISFFFDKTSLGEAEHAEHDEL